ncbi:hypothetical protein ACFOU0_06120 [Salinicoccus sesuvii]|uniref:Uncharacterized protein n=1 Tax=Salinicoccus sesuvii TaxID=868281 RepID=A0ABV7N6F6_9STAP
MRYTRLVSRKVKKVINAAKIHIVFGGGEKMKATVNMLHTANNNIEVKSSSLRRSAWKAKAMRKGRMMNTAPISQCGTKSLIMAYTE